jgi:LmbE family N-acetylglucosaminyl deacetylase
LVVAPHPDDEILGCGGYLLRNSFLGATVGWVVMTSISENEGWAPELIPQRDSEIEMVREGLGILPEHLFKLGFPTTQLDSTPMTAIVGALSAAFRDFEPSEVLVPHLGDVHSDHRVTADAVAACTKWFRYPSVKRVLAYETLSETSFNLDPDRSFNPNVFVDIGSWMDRKLELLRIYASELGEFPFPRSETAVLALAQMRGSTAGFEAAEAFELLRDIVD